MAVLQGRGERKCATNVSHQTSTFSKTLDIMKLRLTLLLVFINISLCSGNILVDLNWIE